MKQEQYCWSQGESVVVGIDEVGKERGQAH